MKRLLSFLLAHFAWCLSCFLFIQRPLFLIYNWNVQDLPMTFGDIVDIYRYGFTLDVATTAYLSIVPILLVWLYALKPFFNIKAWVKGYNVIVALLIALGGVADASLYAFWKFRLDRVVFDYVTDPKNAVASVSTGYVLSRLLLVVVLVVLIWYVISLATRLLPQEKDNSKLTPIKAASVSLAMLLLGGISFWMIRGTGTRPKTPANAFYSSTLYFNHAAINPLFNLLYSLSKSNDFGKQFRYMSEEEREHAVEGLFPVSSDSTLMILKNQRPNVLLIVMEGMGACFVEGLGGIRPVAVSINDIMQHQSYWFANAYAGSFQTDRGLACAMSGFPGLPSVSVMRYTKIIRSFPGLAKSLKAAGYQTQMLYSGDMTYVNFADFFLAVGNDKLVSELDFPEESRSSKWGIPDHVSFQWLFNDIQQRQQSAQPWCISYLTLSSHHPFDVPYHKYKEPLDNGFAYTDSCFGDFIHRLEKTPAWDNLLVVCVADHGYNYSMLEDPAYPHVPLFFTGGAVARLERDDRIVCQTDIPATVLGQLGLPHDDFTYSRDVLSQSYKYPFAMMSYPTGFQFRDSTGVTVYDIIGNQPFSGADPQREHKAKAILQTLYDDLSKR